MGEEGGGGTPNNKRLGKSLTRPKACVTVFKLTETAYISISLVVIFPHYYLVTFVARSAQSESKLERLLCRLNNHVLTSPLTFHIQQMNNNNN